MAAGTTHAAWRTQPSFYTVSTEHRTIDPDPERCVAKRMAAKTIEVKDWHMAVSHPQEITDLILKSLAGSEPTVRHASRNWR